MSALTSDQKNANIQARFEGNKAGTKVKRYNATVDGKTVSMICMNNETIEQAERSCRDRFGGRFNGIVQV
jgi:hypothetical protein